MTAQCAGNMSLSHANIGRKQMYQNILIATDGSELADRGLEHGMKLVHALGAIVTVLRVTEPLDDRARHAASLAGVEDPTASYDASVDEMLKVRFAVIQRRATEKKVPVE